MREPYLEKLLSTGGVAPDNGFLQLNRLLAGESDKTSNLRVVRNLAAALSEGPGGSPCGRPGGDRRRR